MIVLHALFPLNIDPTQNKIQVSKWSDLSLCTTSGPQSMFISWSLQRQLYISKTWSVLRNIVFRPFYSPNVGADFMWRTMIKVTASQGGITWVCNSPSINRLSNGHFHNSHSLVSLQKPQKKSSCPGMKRRGTVIWRWMSFLMSREDPRTGSGGCRGAPCSRSGRRRWRDRRCTWAEDGCLSDSEGWERERDKWSWQVTDLSDAGVWFIPAFELYRMETAKDYLLSLSYGIIGQLQCVSSCQ